MPINIDRKQLQGLSRLELLAKQAVEGFITGLHKSPFHGFSVEFAEHRQYNSGESTRHLDWKLLARTEKLFVKRYEEETNLRCQIIVDCSSSMYFPSGVEAHGQELNKLKFSIYAAAALIELLKHQRDAVGLTMFADKINFSSRAGSSGMHINYLFSELEKLLENVGKSEGAKTMVTDTLHEIAESIHRRSLVVIFSDMFDNSSKSEELFSALQHLRHNKHEVVLFHVVDKKHEIEFNYDNRPYTFTDLESGEEIKVNPADVRNVYVKRMTEFKSDLKVRCGQYRIDFVEADIHNGFNQVLLQYLIKRQKMF
ncbi:MAG: DUF58 domain-containing protein [Crocinitomicaceae bacterium]|nr:DUF58 domain-containing protein [Crocinitomicaceae bacterium]